MGDMWDIGHKKLQDTFSSKKFLLIFGIFLVMSMASVYLGVQSYEQQMDQFKEGSQYGPAPEKPSLIEVFTPLLRFNLPLAAGVLAIILSYDTISKEREEGTIELLLSYPVYRDELINGKFIAGLFTVAVAMLIAFSASTGLSIFLTDALPELSELYRLMFLWQGSVVYMAFFFGLGTLCSAVFSSSRRSLIVSMLALLLFVATPFLTGIAADFVYPMDAERSRTTSQAMAAGATADAGFDDRREEIIQKRQSFQRKVSQISPSSSYSSFVKTMMGENYRSSSGLEPGVWESLEKSISYLVFLFSETFLVFAASYTVFMRQDL